MCGIATVNGEQQLSCLRAEGEVVNHTRWATHGKPDERNVHPHLLSRELARLQAVVRPSD